MPSGAKAYASGTTVSVEKSKAELDTLLGKHGAKDRGIMHRDNSASVVFVLGEHKYSIAVPMPSRLSTETYGANGRVMESRPSRWWAWDAKQRDAWVTKQHDQACRERWRGAVLLLKAKLEMIRLGVSTPEREFLADRVLPNGATVHQIIGELTQRMLAEGPGFLALPEARHG